VLELKVCL